MGPDVWTGLIDTVRAEIDEAVTNTLHGSRALHTYDDVGDDAKRELETRGYAALLAGMRHRHGPDGTEDGEFFFTAGEIRGRQGVSICDLLALWRIALANLHAVARRVAPPGPGRDTLLLEFLELALTWANFAMMHAAEGHRRGALGVAREIQHAQTNCVRRVLSGTASPAEIRGAIEPLRLDPQASYHAVRARPMPGFEMAAIERFLGVDGSGRSGNGLVALIDGDACGFIATLPRTGPPCAVGVAARVPLAAMPSAFRQATRALDTALTLGYKGMFEIGDLGVHPALVTDGEVGDVLLERYLAPVLALTGGDAIVRTVERYLVNDRSVDLTARELEIHPNTVRQRLARFENTTQRSLRDTEAVVELWWALQRRHLVTP